MGEVRRMCNVGIDGKIGFMVPDNVWDEVRGAVLRVLSKHEGELIECDWTLNDDWCECGSQVIIHYPQSREEWSSWKLSDRVEAIAGAKSLDMRVGLFTDETDREKVSKLCSMVAKGEIEVGK